MNEIFLSSRALPLVYYGDFLAASSDFFHADRTADFDVLIYVTKGCIYVTEEQTDFEVNEGELLFLRSGVHHFGKRAIKQGTQWYYIHFSAESAARELPLYEPDEFTDRPILQNEKSAYSVMLPKKLTGLTGGIIEEKIHEFTEYFHSSDTLVRWNINRKLAELLTEIAFIARRPPTETLSDRIARFLNEQKDRPFSARETEKRFFLSYKYMAAVFKKEKGCTMQSYHTKARMLYAARLLRSSLLSVGETAEAVGFADALYFSRCFHSYFGKSPSDYRREIPTDI